MYTLEAVKCLGHCALSPSVVIGDSLYGKDDAERFEHVLFKLAKGA